MSENGPPFLPKAAIFHDPHERNVAMRTRAYRPEAPSCLEDRSLLSGAAGASAHAVVLSGRIFNNVIEQMHFDFQQFARNRDILHLREQLWELAALLPFRRADNLGLSINLILKNMQQNIFDRDPQAIRTARNQVIAVTRANIEARIQAGDVIVRG